MTARKSEWRAGWPTVLAAASGVGLGIAGLLTYTAGLFAADLHVAIGLSRTQLGLGFFLSTVALAIAMPIVGLLVDRFGPRWPAVGGAIFLALGFVALGHQVSSVPAYLGLMASVGALAAASGPAPYARAVVGAFDRSRGLALGLMQVGIGVSAMLVPPALAYIIATQGWRTGYYSLAALAVMGIIPALTMPSFSKSLKPNQKQAAPPVNKRLYTLLLACFAVMALAFAGLLTHFVPMLIEAGLSPKAAGGMAGIIGFSVIASRLVVGWLADRVNAARIASICCFICALGSALLAFGDPRLAWLGAMAIGTAMGAEADLIGFMVARYFGMATYGRLYSIQYASFMLMAGLSPLWIGAVADRTGGYTQPLLICITGLAVAAILFTRLPSTLLARPANGVDGSKF